MAYIKCVLRSDLLQTGVEVQLYTPADLPLESQREIKGTLTLLHGYSNTGNDWMQMSAASRYAADNGLVLICPSCSNSFYQDTGFYRWKTFITNEMPELLSRMFKFPREREKNYIAGLSMGGYGALYIALSRPDLYAGCASFSGAVDVQYFLDESQDLLRYFVQSTFQCENTLPDESNIYILADAVAKLPKEKQPKILLTNGYEDVELYAIKQQNDNMYSHLKTLPLNELRRMEWTGIHEWNFWDRSLVYAIDYFLQNNYAAKKHADWQHQPTIT